MGIDDDAYTWIMRTDEYATEKTLNEKARRWLDAVRGSVAPRPHLQVSPERCALVVVDMLRYFASPNGRCFLPASAGIAPQIRSLLDAWRRNGGTVVFTRHCHEGEHDLGMLGRFFSDHIACGEPDSQIIEMLEPLDGERVFNKTTYDAFIGTDLEEYLKKERMEQVLVTGVLTHMCCETTARSAFCRGFEVYVPVDATASNCEERHLASLMAMADAVAVVLRTDEVLKLWEKNK